ncbi:MAG: hypothetical protein NTW96_01060, partial [Planctomycetia bacterium]|nr:hypothetical protein [Planctomycetia bacterium]
GGVEYVDVIQNAFSNNMQTRWSGEIATWYGTYDKHCRFSQNDFTVLNTKAPIIFECSGSNEGIAPPVINGAGVSFGYDDTAGENVWTIPFTATQGQSVFTDGTFVFEVYASNVDFAYDQGGHVNGYGAGAYVYLEGRDVPCQLDGLVGQGEDFTAKVPASTLNLLPGFTKFLMTATCTEVEEGTKDRNDTSIFSEPVETPPQVTGVTVSNGTDEYAIPAERDSGAQLECVPFRYLPELGYGGPPRITQVQVTFNQDVLVDSGDLTLVDAADENTSYSPTGFSSAYAGGVETATWTFNPITWKQLVLTISSGLEGVTGAEGLQLDGDWTNNPTGFSDEYENSIFPSGNGDPGGDFVFYFTVPSPADFNLDGKVDYTDASILGAHYFQQVPVWGPGDANGDGMANTPDAAIFAYHWGTDFTTWPSEQEKSGGGSKRSASRDLELALDALFERYDFGTPDESRPVEREDNYWNGFIDDFLGIYSEVAA